MAVSNAGLVWLTAIAGMSLSLFGLGLGWNLAYVAASTELVSLAAPVGARPAVGFSDLLSSFVGARARARRRGGLHGPAARCRSPPSPRRASRLAGRRLSPGPTPLLPFATGGRLVRRFSV